MTSKWKNLHKEWHRYQSTHNNALDVIGTMNTNGAGTFGADWARCVSPVKDKIFINGKGLSEYAKEFDFYAKNQTTTELNIKVKKFFHDVLLKDVSCPAEDKQKMADYLATVFHQGGLMNPGSTGVSAALTNFGAAVDTTSLDTRLDIVTTLKGIKVHEVSTVNQLLVPDDKVRERLKLVDSPVIMPDGTKSFVLQTSVAIDVNFISPNKPSIMLEANKIDYGNDLIKKALPERGLFKSIVEFIVHLFKSNTVQVAPLNAVKSTGPETSVVAEKTEEENETATLDH